MKLAKHRFEQNLTRKRIKTLNQEQQNRLIEMKALKETARFLLPDAPERKRNRRNESPSTVSCYITPDTPAIPPPRVRKTWEINAMVPQTPSYRQLPHLAQLPVLEGNIAENVVIEDIDQSNMMLTSDFGNPVIEDPVVADSRQLREDRDELSQTSDDESDDQNPLEQAIPENLDVDVHERMSILDTENDRAIQRLLTREDLIFDWHNDQSVFKGKRETFTGVAGPTCSISDVSTPMEIFSLFFNEELITLIVDETNRYAQSCLESGMLSEHARMRKWGPVSREEVWTFLAILIWQGLYPLSVEKEYWFPPLPYVMKSHLSTIIPYSRFILIKRCLHFVSNNVDLNATQEQQRLFKIQPVVDHLNKKFSELYYPAQEVALDESLLLWKGRLNRAQKISTKAAEVGLKTFELCESKTGYLYKFVVYAGKSSNRIANHSDSVAPKAQEHPEGSTAKIVFDLARPLFNKGHTLVMDNFYNSPLLSRALKRNGTDTMGTLRLNHQFVPDTLKKVDKNELRVGEVIFSHTEDLAVVVWKDQDLVSLISTYHKCEVGGREKYGQYKYRPQVVLDYNLAMGGVDKKDQLLSAFPIERVRNLVWYKKLFRRLLNITILNANIIYNHHRIKKTSAREFRLGLVDSIFQAFSARIPQSIQTSPNVQHFIEKGESNRARCRMCSKRGALSRTGWRCDTCKVPLCIVCFKDFHCPQ